MTMQTASGGSIQKQPGAWRVLRTLGLMMLVLFLAGWVKLMDRMRALLR